MPTIYLTDTEIDEALRILKGARQSVNQGRALCGAIRESSFIVSYDSIVSVKLRAYIMRDLKTSSMVYAELKALGKQDQTLDIRKLWLKQMIAALQAAKKKAS